MRYLTFLFLFISTVVFTQNISELVDGYKKKFNPLFSAESAIITMELFKNYTIDKTDTSFIFVINIENSDVELESISIGSTFFGSSLLGGAQGNYSIAKKKNQIVMDKKTFSDFCAKINKVFVFMTTMQNIKKSKNEILATERVENIVLGGEYKPKALNNKVNFYFKIDDTVTYNMLPEDFIEILKLTRDMEKYWSRQKT